MKYSVKDGKEINLMRQDSEAGQKCCAFQHWVYHKTEGNLLVTDMQGSLNTDISRFYPHLSWKYERILGYFSGVGMKLTDVGIATTKKG